MARWIWVLSFGLGCTADKNDSGLMVTVSEDADTDTDTDADTDTDTDTDTDVGEVCEGELSELDWTVEVRDGGGIAGTSWSTRDSLELWAVVRNP